MRGTFIFNLADSGVTKNGNIYRVQALRCGKWDYPRPGEKGFEITSRDLTELRDNFYSGIKGFKVPLNIDHKDGKDCGWVVGLELGEDQESLFALFEVTKPDVREDVDNGTIQFSSSELDLSYVSPELSAAGDMKPRKVFEGLALTNHPYIKGMAPISPVMLSDQAALNAAQVHYPAVMADRDDEKEETPMADNNELVANLQEQVKKLTEEVSALKTADAPALRRQIELSEVESKVKRLIRRGKVTPALGNKVLRFAELLINSGSGKVALNGARPDKYRLADEKDDESMDKLDVIQEVVSMLGQLPDAVAMDSTNPALAEDAEEEGGHTDEDEDKELLKKADEIQASDKDLNYRECLKLARVQLKERKVGSR